MTKPKDPKDYCKIGRPGWDYTESLGKEICETLATSPHGLKTLCKMHKNWPGYNVIYKWVFQFSDFANMYAHAREMQQEVLVNEMMEISTNREHDFYTTEKGEVPNMARIARDKLIADNTKWSAARLNRRYREKQQLEQNIYTHEEQLKDLA